MDRVAQVRMPVFAFTRAQVSGEDTCFAGP